MLFLVASVAISIAVGSWWMQRIAFTPDGTRDTTAAILSDPDIRLDINGLVSAAAVPYLTDEPITEIIARVETQVLSTRAGAAMMAPIIEQLHRRIIGLRDDPVEITGAQMVEIVRDQRVADAATLTVPVEPIGTLDNMRGVLGWLMIISAGLGLLAGLLGLITRPERQDVLRGLGELCLAIAASMLLFGYLLPVHLLTAINNQTWTHAIPELAQRTLPVVFGTTAIAALAGGALIIASRSGGKRRQWSTPLAAARYRGGNNPGWG